MRPERIAPALFAALLAGCAGPLVESFARPSANLVEGCEGAGGDICAEMRDWTIADLHADSLWWGRDIRRETEIAGKRIGYVDLPRLTPSSPCSRRRRRYPRPWRHQHRGAAGPYR